MPLALTTNRAFDERSARALLRYYVDAGVGGLAVGVHATQFAIRDVPGFYESILRFAMRESGEWARYRNRDLVMIAGICGRRDQAIAEAELAAEAGYHAGLLSMSALADASTDELVEHARVVSQRLPVIGFYLQTAVGGMVLPYEFWREFARIERVWGIKIAPFNRYATLAVIRAVVDSGRSREIALYTGNDDTIVADLLTEFTVAGEPVRIVGGLLGHWGVWTRRAVELFERCRSLVRSGDPVPPELLTLAAQVTEMNGALFDASHGYAGCLPGVNEVLRRQGLVRAIACLDQDERLSDGQADELTRVTRAYPHLVDDDFVQEHLDEWLR